MRKTCNIYGVIDPREREEFRYVGKTPYSIEKRLGEHIWEANQKGEKKVKDYKCNWIRKLLRNNITPTIVLIDTVPMKEWAYWEKYYIKLYKNLGHRLTNLTEGGEGTMGWVPTKETKRKIGKAKLGKTYEEMYGIEKAKEMKKVLRKIQLGNHHIPETIENLRKINLGKNNPQYSKVGPMKNKKHTESAKANMRDGWDEDAKEKQRKSKLGKNNPNYNKHPSKKTRKLLSKANSGKNNPRYSKHLSKDHKEILREIKLGKTWEEMYGAEKANEMRKKATKRMLDNTFNLGRKFPNGYKKEKLNKVA